jgi:hypothetical protein
MHYSHEHYATLLRITSTFFNVTSYLTHSNRSYFLSDRPKVCLPVFWSVPQWHKLWLYPVAKLEEIKGRCTYLVVHGLAYMVEF